MQSKQRAIAAAAFLVTAATILMPLVKAPAQAPPAGYANFEGSQTNPVRLSPDGARLFAVNTPNGSLSVFDVTNPGSPALLADIPVGIEPVSVNPVSDNEAWVVNQVSDSISIVSVSQGIVVNTISLPDLAQPGTPLPEPMDVVFAGTQAYVSISRANSIAVFDMSTRSLVSIIPVFGGSPRAMAVSPDGGTVYAAMAISGNATTIIDLEHAPPQPPPANPALPPAPHTALIVSATDPAWQSYVTFKMPDNDVVAITTGATPAIAGYYSGVGTINLGLGVNPTNGDLYVANTDALNLVHFESNLLGHFVNSRITHIDVSSGQITPFDLNPNIDYSVQPSSASLATALAQPTNVVFDPSGNFMYVAAYGTDRVAKVDTNGNVLSFVEVSQASGSGSNVDPANKRGPRGLALNAPAQTLYSLNRISNSISVINTASNAVTKEVFLTDPTPAAVKQGRGFLYDAKLSGSGAGSCASCHIDGDMDHLAWDLGDPAGDMTSLVQDGKLILFHPMKGPMTTQTLHGLSGLAPYHWRGDKPDFAAFNAAFPSLMGGPQIATADMTAYTTFVNSILFLPNPYQTLNRELPASLNGGSPGQGKNDFLTVPKTSGRVTCNACHTSDPGPGTNLTIDPGVDPQAIKMPQLRNIYQKQLYNRFGATSIDGFGLDNDGGSAGLAVFLAGPNFKQYTAQQKTDMIAYSLAFDTGTAPAVGYTLTLSSSTVTLKAAQTVWALMQSQAAAGNIDLIARGTIQGQLHGLLFQSSTANYVSDTGAVYTQAQLQAFMQAGDTLSFMGAYPGTGSASHRGQARRPVPGDWPFS
jgi:YVTN family beta-propeller protein